MGDSYISLTGFDPSIILSSIYLVIKEQNRRTVISVPEDYLIEDTSWRVIKLILGTVN